MSKLNRKAIEVLDVCLASESPEIKAKVYQIIEWSELDPTDPMFLVLALTGQMRVLLETAPEELSKLLQEWKEQSDSSLQSIQQAVTQISSTQQQQALTIKRTLEQVSLGYASEMKEVGQATVSAIAEANSETLLHAQQTAQGAKEVASAVISLKTRVDSEQVQLEQSNQQLVEQVQKAKTELQTAIKRTDSLHNSLTELQNKVLLTYTVSAIAPLALVLISMAAGGIIWAIIMHFYWGDSEKYLPVIKQNQAAFDRCFTEDEKMKPGIVCTVEAQKVKAPKKK